MSAGASLLARRPDTSHERGPATSEVAGPSHVSVSLYDSSDSATLRVRLGSTWTPGPMVVDTVIFRT
jgi:hypothetical protein